MPVVKAVINPNQKVYKEFIVDEAGELPFDSRFGIFGGNSIGVNTVRTDESIWPWEDHRTEEVVSFGDRFYSYPIDYGDSHNLVDIYLLKGPTIFYY